VLAQNGYIALPGGLIMQWGYNNTFNGAGAPNPVVFPIPFLHACFSVLLTPIQQSGQHSMAPSIAADTSPGTGGFSWQSGTGTDNDGTCPIYWFAVGY
jgi:hypothetical protein